MLRNLKNRLNENKGFSLVELIVVIAIMVILIALLVPNVVGYISKAQDSANLSAAKSIYNAVNTAVIDYKAQNAGYPTCDQLKKELNIQAHNTAEALVVVPEGTACSILYDGKGYVYAVACSSSSTDVASGKNIQVYSPLASGNAYFDGQGATPTGKYVVNSDLASFESALAMPGSNRAATDGNGAGPWTGGQDPTTIPSTLATVVQSPQSP